ncbi:hypothetical protein DRP77_11200 [Candidatus Poribacteria bacterium]|nr:MAG: hypothetical protein DRP77_11200 [Candidatus Poribacteria bacterium]
MAAVTVIAAGLTAVALPIAQQQISQAKKANAVEETKQLGTAVMRFWNDTGGLPNAADIDGDGDVDVNDMPIEVLFTGVYDPVNNISTLPADSTGTWTPATVLKMSVMNFLVVNDPDLDGFPDDAYANWGGPYIGVAKEETALDPWGHSYLINVNENYPIIVISAGPDGRIDTSRNQPINSFTVQGDDIVVRIR